MENKDISLKNTLFFGIGSAVVEMLYIALVVTIIYNSEKIFGVPPGKEFWGIVFTLMLLVFRVAVSGIVVFGYPVYLGFKKKFKEAIFTTALTLLTLFVTLLLLIFINFIH